MKTKNHAEGIGIRNGSSMGCEILHQACPLTAQHRTKDAHSSATVKEGATRNEVPQAGRERGRVRESKIELRNEARPITETRKTSRVSLQARHRNRPARRNHRSNSVRDGIHPGKGRHRIRDRWLDRSSTNLPNAPNSQSRQKVLPKSNNSDRKRDLRSTANGPLPSATLKRNRADSLVHRISQIDLGIGNVRTTPRVGARKAPPMQGCQSIPTGNSRSNDGKTRRIRSRFRFYKCLSTASIFILYLQLNCILAMCRTAIKQSSRFPKG